MSLKEKLIQHIQDKTGNPNADLWTLKFDENDANVTLNEIASPYVNGILIRTKGEVDKDAYNLLRNQ